MFYLLTLVNYENNLKQVGHNSICLSVLAWLKTTRCQGLYQKRRDIGERSRSPGTQSLGLVGWDSSEYSSVSLFWTSLRNHPALIPHRVILLAWMSVKIQRRDTNLIPQWMKWQGGQIEDVGGRVVFRKGWTQTWKNLKWLCYANVLFP